MIESRWHFFRPYVRPCLIVSREPRYICASGVPQYIRELPWTWLLAPVSIYFIFTFCEILTINFIKLFFSLWVSIRLEKKSLPTILLWILLLNMYLTEYPYLRMKRQDTCKTMGISLWNSYSIAVSHLVILKIFTLWEICIKGCIWISMHFDKFSFDKYINQFIFLLVCLLF